MFDFSSQQSQLMLLAGMILLGWTLIRRQVKSRQRRWRDDQQQRQTLRQTASDTQRSMPLADAPVETLRWQAAMFDLQRDLKAELDTKIAVVQSLLRQVDQRLAKLDTASAAAVGPLSVQQLDEAQRLQREGIRPREIATRIGASLDDVEAALTTSQRP